MKVKEESEKVGLKLNIQKTKIMASSAITLWQIDGENEETVSDFIFLGSEITSDSDGIYENKRYFLLGRIATTSLDNVLKSRGNILPTNPYSQIYGFSSSYAQMWVLDRKRRLSTEKLLLLNCSAGDLRGPWKQRYQITHF